MASSGTPSPSHPILSASTAGDAARIAELIEEGTEVPHDSDQPLATPCEQAALHGHLDALKLLLPSARRQLALSFADAPEGSKDATKATHAFWSKLLTAAIRGGHEHVVEFLLSASDINLSAAATKGEREQPPLFEAVENDLSGMLELLMRHGASLCDAKDPMGRSLLHCAAEFGATKCWSVLIKNCEGHLDSRDQQGNTPLHYAVEFGREDFARQLIRAGVDVNARNERRVTPVHLAASTGNPEMLKLLLVEARDEIDVNTKDYNGKTPLHDVVQLDVAALDDESPTPVKDREEKVVQLVDLLLSHSADSDMVDQVTRDTPLHVAVRRGLERTTHSLLVNGADPNAADKFGVTPMHVAAAFDASRELWAMLLQHGGDTALLDAEGHAPLDLVKDEKTRADLQTLVTHYQKP